MNDADKVRLDDAALAYIADELHKEIRRRANLYGVDESDVIAAIEASNVMIENIDAEGMKGLFLSAEESGKPWAVIKVTLDGEEAEILQILVHEYCRYLMRNWVAEHLFQRETVESSHENIPEMKQRIATMVHRRW